MRPTAWVALLAAVGCADVLGIEDAHLTDPRDSSLPDSSDHSGGTGSGSASQNGGSDEDDGSQGAAGPEGSGGGAGTASSPDDSPDDPEPELPPSDSDGGSAGSDTGGGATGNGGTGGSSSTSGGSNSSGGTTSNGGTDSSGGTTSSGGSAGTSSNGGSASGGTSGNEPPPLSCQSYCATVLANCKGQYAQYRSEQECLSVCALLPAGGPLSLSDNSVSCRAAEATLAGLAPDDHCANAGPAGNSKCGDTCDGFCSVVLSACKASDSKHSLPNLAKCNELCLGRTDLGDYGTAATLGYDKGDTQQCLLSHATAATTAGVKECESAVGKADCEEKDD